MVGKNIKNLRELKNYTQTYMAEQLNLSVAGYGKIERDETDISLKRINQIAQILETDISTILNFESKNVFNQSYNTTANGIVHTQQIVNDSTKLNDTIQSLCNEIITLRDIIANAKTI